MLKVLIKKQLTEVFRGYFYNAKKNKMRSKKEIVFFVIFFIVVMAGVLGGMFTGLSLLICEDLVKAGMGWMYFLLMGGIAIVLGAFGSVFNTYAGLYLAKDNDLLLSLPIPVKTIMVARLANVYLIGTMYAATALIPMLVVYWVKAGITPLRVIFGLLLFLDISVIILLLSCLLGWVVAKISLRLKNRSFVTVLVSLLFVGAYYFLYFRANDLVRDIISNASVYGEKIRGRAYGLYLFGRVGEGDWAAAGIVTGVTVALFLLVFSRMQRSFLKIATASPHTEKIRYTEKRIKRKSVFGALLSKEFGRFFSNPTYMLNCGLSTLLIPAFGIFLLFKGREIFGLLAERLPGRPGLSGIILCTILCMLVSLNDIAAPSVSLEGKSIWNLQSLPVSAGSVLRAKASVQLILTGIPMLLAGVCAVIASDGSLAVKALIFIMPLLFTVFSALFNTAVGVRMPVLGWTNETAPIKQSAVVAIALFGGWLISVIFGGLYFLIGYKIGVVWYLLVWCILFAVVSVLLLRWLDTRGARAFEEL